MMAWVSASSPTTTRGQTVARSSWRVTTRAPAFASTISTSIALGLLRGEQSIRGPVDTIRVRAGQGEAGRGAGVPMQVSSSGDGELLALVMFVVDATKPFSSPAENF